MKFCKIQLILEKRIFF